MRAKFEFIGRGTRAIVSSNAACNGSTDGAQARVASGSKASFDVIHQSISSKGMAP
jgi:hypothetical protein